MSSPAAKAGSQHIDRALAANYTTPNFQNATMKISELQEYLKDRLNAVEALMHGNCKAFAEDTRTVYDEPGYVRV